MSTYNQDNAQSYVFTFKEGLLSPMAHDLRVKIGRFTIDVDDASGAVSASFDTSSLVIDTPMKDGNENPSALSDSDKQKIAGQIREDVLHSGKFPEATFKSRSVQKRADGGFDLDGDLTLHGVTKPISAKTQVVGGKQQLDFDLSQPEFGITPYKAMMGTLKIQAVVKVRVVT